MTRYKVVWPDSDSPEIRPNDGEPHEGLNLAEAKQVIIAEMTKRVDAARETIKAVRRLRAADIRRHGSTESHT